MRTNENANVESLSRESITVLSGAKCCVIVDVGRSDQVRCFGVFGYFGFDSTCFVAEHHNY